MNATQSNATKMTSRQIAAGQMRDMDLLRLNEIVTEQNGRLFYFAKCYREMEANGVRVTDEMRRTNASRAVMLIELAKDEKNSRA